MKNKVILLLMMLALFSLSSCHEDEDDNGVGNAAGGQWMVSLATIDDGSRNDPSLLSRYASYESAAVSISGLTADTRTVVITSDADWLKLRSNTLAADNIIAFTTTDNRTDQRRTATLTFADADRPGLTGTLTLTQCSAADQDTNGEDARADLYVGYGYNIYAALENPMSVRTTSPVLDMRQLRLLASMDAFHLIQDCHLSYTTMNYTSVNTIQALGENLSERQTGDSQHTIQGCTEDCLTAVDLMEGDAKGHLDQQNYGQGSLEKTVASRVIDRGLLQALVRSGKLPLSNAFGCAVQEISDLLKTGGNARDLTVQTLRKFGTHLVTQVDLGGRIDYIFTMSKHATFNTKQEMEQEIKYTLGQISDTERQGTNLSTTSSKTADGAIKIHGGSEATRKILQDDINDKQFKGQLKPSHVTDWLASINYTDHLTLDEDLDVVHFELVPLWDVVPTDVRQIFLDETMRMVQESASGLPASFTGTDIYEFNTDQWPNLFDFSRATADSSLCRLLYMDYNSKSNEGIGSAIEAASGDPVLQVCSEYVPKIRTDQRVTIVYPIHEQKVRLNEGLFLGDGIHQPAWVGFKGNDCYVNLIDNLAPGTCIKQFWFVNGNLKLKNPTTLEGLHGNNPIVRDDCFYYTLNYLYSYPIVKIGANFWTRRDVDNDMGFTSNPDSRRNRADEHLVDSVLYARFYYDIGYYQQKDNGWLWGYEPNNYYTDKPNTKWYMPLTTEIENLYAYLGFNPKALYAGQQSGFNAQFHGYYGVHDLLNNVGFGTNNDIRYRNEYMFLASRTDITDKAMVMVLDSEYHLQMMEPLGDWSKDYFPLRPVRGWMFTYPKLSEIIKNTNL
jgi:hypothetical protein